MGKKTLFFTLLVVAVIGITGTCFAQQEEKLTITTYYPSPYGVYRELRSQRMAIGETYYRNTVVC